ncbi:PAS domain S-box/diguanylate cyclase (GGDEF) domain containing hypothetical protein [Phytophthora palmivora]|uniref:Uncharacterized protein n=1 Tax=Phytophthora palmivora TaxID=4796 RepID=A0A2P4YGA2_9STRA|nr:PAS domain S-box/diguanylate cyclase (GGDEF) domain containing hypothetical protein [Phytophthora palmivora]
MRQFAVRHNMNVNLAAENRGGLSLRSYKAKITGANTERLLHQSLTITVNSSPVREDELIRSLAASDAGISRRVLVEHINRIHGAETRSEIQLVMPYVVIVIQRLA